MRQRIVHGATIDVATPDDVRRAVAEQMPQTTLIRTSETVALDSTGAGEDEVYKVPLGYEFAARRLFVNISTASDPSTGSVPLNIAGKYIALLRSGTFIEYAILLAPTAIAQVPGLQTWSNEEGPYLRNGEVFQVKAFGLTPNATLTVNLQGLLHRPGGTQNR